MTWIYVISANTQNYSCLPNGVKYAGATEYPTGQHWYLSFIHKLLSKIE